MAVELAAQQVQENNTASARVDEHGNVIVTIKEDAKDFGGEQQADLGELIERYKHYLSHDFGRADAANRPAFVDGEASVQAKPQLIVDATAVSRDSSEFLLTPLLTFTRKNARTEKPLIASKQGQGMQTAAVAAAPYGAPAREGDQRVKDKSLQTINVTHLSPEAASQRLAAGEDPVELHDRQQADELRRMQGEQAQPLLVNDAGEVRMDKHGNSIVAVQVDTHMKVKDEVLEHIGDLLQAASKNVRQHGGDVIVDMNALISNDRKMVADIALMAHNMAHNAAAGRVTLAGLADDMQAIMDESHTRRFVDYTQDAAADVSQNYANERFNVAGLG